ncbi:MBL fold metallo-hydrolase [Actinotalea sp. BY-33]|uniref:MBL fold metallo-hydrolase n=1 Tax=Actinotalea soli TaxID=2819234 RepID=A0A939RUQ0_9CELL|nr:MBL fold metallo-hydrolase [Actinotalea soli]MBO1750863.1 MBL fold metallo-hydrolase [Actinotalea soli]
MASWVEVADGVLVLRHAPGAIDVTSTAVLGPTGVVVVDTLGTPAVASRAHARLLARTGLPVVGIVHTHAHHDHTFGATSFATPEHGRATTYAHHRFAEHLERHEEAELAAGRAGDLALDDPTAWDDVTLVGPDVPVTGTTTIRPAGRELVLHPLPTAHTTCDLVVHVPDAATWVVGDVVEESAAPSFEVDSDPVGWAAVVTALAAQMEPRAVVVPGHGACVDPGFVAAQGRELTALAAALEDCRLRGVGAGPSIASLREATGWHAGTLRAAARAFWSAADGPVAPP